MSALSVLASLVQKMVSMKVRFAVVLQTAGAVASADESADWKEVPAAAGWMCVGWPLKH